MSADVRFAFDTNVQVTCEVPGTSFPGVEVEARDIELLLGLSVVESVEAATGWTVKARVDRPGRPCEEELVKLFVPKALDHRRAVARRFTGVNQRVTASHKAGNLPGTHSRWSSGGCGSAAWSQISSYLATRISCFHPKSHASRTLPSFSLSSATSFSSAVVLESASVASPPTKCSDWAWLLFTRKSR